MVGFFYHVFLFRFQSFVCNPSEPPTKHIFNIVCAVFTITSNGSAYVDMNIMLIH